MLKGMNDDDWATVLRVFAASCSRRGAKGRNDRHFLEALHYFTVHNITWRALPACFMHRAAVGDKGYGATANRQAARFRGICPVIPYRPTSRVVPASRLRPSVTNSSRISAKTHNFSYMSVPFDHIRLHPAPNLKNGWLMTVRGLNGFVRQATIASKAPNAPVRARTE
ncbi:hypothetical protein [Mesorhizobium sp.]|uniref:hypothetical protein n=1 Tax=Mesorhizobium sp. TaxID=1871066 RepID=UPI00120CEDB8|nr:hypothetical protein [Mesorhizobium sp.]TIP08014.1 MAG: transposase [Mesorhizobium sp.]